MGLWPDKWVFSARPSLPCEDPQATGRSCLQQEGAHQDPIPCPRASNFQRPEVDVLFRSPARVQGGGSLLLKHVGQGQHHHHRRPTGQVL